jgi:hypothetical protein
MMAVPDPFLSLNYPSDQSLVWLKERLSAANLYVVQTFDLTTARQGLDDCPCPYHGTDQCDCQMIILFVYSNGAEPATLILHGNGGQTWLSLVERPGQQPAEGTVRSIQMALDIPESNGT